MTNPAPADSTRWIAVSAGAAFAAYYSFYVAAPVIFAGATPSAGVRVAIFMLVVVAAQPVVLIAGRWMRNRRAIAITTLAAMALGAAGLPLAGHWPGPLLQAAGFGLFVVTSTAWVKENASPERLGRALGSYGFGSSFGGAFGAPAGLLAAARFGMTGVAFTAAGLALVAIAAAIISRRRTEATTASGTAAASGPSTTSGPATASGPGDSEVLAVCLDGGTVPVHGRGAVAASAGGHLVAVTLYAATLTALGELSAGASLWVLVGSAFLIQVFLSFGRLAGGFGCDRWSAMGTGAVSLLVLIGVTAGFFLSPSPVLLLGFAALIGLSAGAAQAAALTIMMSRADTPQETERASALWNICFDIGLGLGALAGGTAVHR